MPRLSTLTAGTRFSVPALGLSGRLMMVNACRARVRIDQPQREVEFTAGDGTSRVFRARRTHETSWSPAVVVEVLSYEPLSESESLMATAKTSTTSKMKKTRSKPAPAQKAAESAAIVGNPADDETRKPASRKREARNPKPRKLSALDGAAKVLAETKEPMTTKALIEAMAAKGYWNSPGGQTPHATLYAALLREINTKGTESRFQKTDRGLFALNS